MTSSDTNSSGMMGGGKAAKNAHGVYVDRDELRLLDGRAQISLAEVRVADTDDGWRAVACFAFTTGNWWGQFSPITDRCPSFGYREAAIASAASDLFEHLSNAPRHAVEQSMEGQKRKILNWLAGLSVARPQQMDLFA